MPLRLRRKSRSEVTGQSCRALPGSETAKTGHKETFSGCWTQRNHRRHRLVACRAARVSFGGATAELRRSVRQSSQPRGGDAASLRDLEVLDQKRERK